MSASRIATTATSGRSRPSRRRLIPMRHVEEAAAEIARGSRPGPASRCPSGGTAPDADLGEVVGQLLRHPLGQRRHEDALVPRRRRPGRPRAGRPPGPSTGRISICGSSRPVGRMTCSTISPPARSSSSLLGVALTAMTWWTRSRELVVGQRTVVQRATAGGTRSRPATCLRERSPKNIPRTCGSVTCDSSTTSRKSSGK